MTITPFDARSVTNATRILHQGGVVAFPTETVYGLGADATQDDAVAKVFSIKGRPAINPLIIHVGRPDWVAGLAQPDGRFDALTRAFWPGPLTLVLRRRPDCPVSAAVSAGLESIAVRQPNHPAALDLLKQVKRPLAAPSANPSGHVSPTKAQHVEEDLGDHIDMILDGGACPTGIESTVLDITTETAHILRPGAIDANSLADVIGPVSDRIEAAAAIISPGQMAKHYAPSLPVRLNVPTANQGEALIGFGVAPEATINLSPTGDLVEAATALFATLRALDDPSQFSAIAVMPIPNEGLGCAINARLSRAAAGR